MSVSRQPPWLQQQLQSLEDEMTDYRDDAPLPLPPGEVPQPEDDAAPVMEEEFVGFSGGPQTELQDRMYPATLIGFKSRWMEKGMYGPHKAVIWRFGIENPPEEVEALTSEATGENSTARPWLVALVGKARVDQMVKEKRMIPAEELVGRECMVLVEIRDNGYPRVTQVLPGSKS